MEGAPTLILLADLVKACGQLHMVRHLREWGMGGGAWRCRRGRAEVVCAEDASVFRGDFESEA